jgi:hypothetical protein
MLQKGFLRTLSKFYVRPHFKKKIIIKKGNFTKPHVFLPILKYPHKLQKYLIYTFKLSIAFNLDPSVQIRAQNFLKIPKYP